MGRVVATAASDVVPSVPEASHDLTGAPVPPSETSADHVVATEPALAATTVRVLVAGVLPGLTMAPTVLTERSGLPPVGRAGGRLKRPVPASATVRQAPSRIVGPGPVGVRHLRPGVIGSFGEVPAIAMATVERAAPRSAAVVPVEVPQGAPPVILQDVGSFAGVAPTFTRVRLLLPVRVAPPRRDTVAVARVDVRDLLPLCPCGPLK